MGVLGAGDIGEVVKGAGQLAEFINTRVTKVEKANLLAEWRDLMIATDTDDTAMKIRQYLTKRLQERLYSPWYEEKEWIAVPKDILTDAVDIMVGGPQRSRGMLATILSALGLGGVRATRKQLEDWNAVIQTRHRQHILDAFQDYLADAGRVRSYNYADPSVPLDPDMLADMGSYVIQG
jgi:hypothetical protein